MHNYYEASLHHYRTHRHRIIAIIPMNYRVIAIAASSLYGIRVELHSQLSHHRGQGRWCDSGLCSSTRIPYITSNGDVLT